VPEHLSYRFDRLQWLERGGYLHRKILFLDLNFWIRLSEGRSTSHLKLGALLAELVEAGELICPVSPSLLMELTKRQGSNRRDRYCRLMNQLSQGVSLRLSPFIFADEFKTCLEGGRLERHMGYSHFMDALFGELNLVFPESGWTESETNRAKKLVFDDIGAMSIIEIVNLETEESRERSIAYLRKGWSELCRQEGEWRRENHSSFQAIEQAEFAATVRSLIPQIWRVLRSADITSLQRRLQSTSLDEKREILNACPTFWCEYKLLSALRSNRSRVTENDLWDLQHVASVVPYVDCLACDRGTRHLCSDMLKLDRKHDLTILSQEDDLMAWLRAV